MASTLVFQEEWTVLFTAEASSSALGGLPALGRTTGGA